MVIKRFCENVKPVKIGDIIFELYGVNVFDDADTEDKFPYSTLDGEEELTFTERYEKALLELEEDTKGMNIKEAQKYYKEQTDDDNANYYGNLCFVYTKSFDDDSILFGVRMD